MMNAPKPDEPPPSQRTPGPSPLAARENLDTISRAQRGGSFGGARYWSEQWLDRLDFVRRILGELHRRGWPHAPGTGWDNFDVEIHGSRWCLLRLTTVAEAHPHGRQLIRCRLRIHWSFLANTVVWASCGVALLLYGLTGRSPWLGGALCAGLGALGFWLHFEGRSLQRIFSVLLDDVAKGLKLAKVDSKPSPEGTLAHQ
jgi:hypothetical protein